MTPETVITLLLTAIKLAQELGIDVQKANEAITRAREEGRPISDQELADIEEAARDAVSRL